MPLTEAALYQMRSDEDIPMGTTEYLRGLNLDQLRFAKQEAQRLIDEVESQEKVTLWVCGAVVNEYCFREDQFEQAKKRLCEMIMSDDFGPNHLRMDHPMITKYTVYESEVDDWMSLNDG